MKDPEDSFPSNGSQVEPFFVGNWLVQPGLNRITGKGPPVQIEPRIMHVLTCLASRPGQVISRATLLDIVWNRTIVNEEALTQAISHLRRVFADDPKSPAYIETIPKSGYRLIAPVSHDPAVERTILSSPPTFTRQTRRAGLFVGITVFLIATAAVTAFLIQRSRSASQDGAFTLETRPFTSDPGEEICPAISPDGTRIAYSWRRKDEHQYDLYMKQRNADAILRLTDTPGNEYYVVWSPDGSEIAYVHQYESETAVYTMPTIGGKARKILDAEFGMYGMDWSPDGEWLLYSSRAGAGEPMQVYSFSFATREVRTHTSPEKGSRGDFRPTFSPDGTRIAFIRGDRTNLEDIYMTPTDGGDLRRITHSQHHVSGLDWMPDGRSLIFCSGPTRAGDFRLWRLILRDASLLWLPSRSHRPVRVSVAVTGTGLVYEEQSVAYNIMRFRVDDPGDPDVPPAPLIASTLHDYGPQYSPAGQWISFISNRTGNPQIWICDSEGQNARQITDFEGAYLENSCWSYDENRVAFSAAPGNYTAMYIVDLETEEVRCLSTSDRHEKCLGWSRDGEWLYCKSERDDAWWVWKRRIDGSESVDIVEEDIFRLAEATDGKRLLYSRADTTGVWSVNLDGTGRQCVVNGPGYVVPCGWREVEEGIYFFSADESTISLWLLDAASGETSLVASSRSFFAINLDVSPDGMAVIYDHSGPFHSDLVLVEDFR